MDVEWQVMRPGQRRKLEPGSPEAVSEKRKASVRAKVEHPFLYIKRHFGSKVRQGAVQEHAMTHGVCQLDEGRTDLAA